jgi:hypothetical protein
MRDSRAWTRREGRQPSSVTRPASTLRDRSRRGPKRQLASSRGPAQTASFRGLVSTGSARGHGVTPSLSTVLPEIGCYVGATLTRGSPAPEGTWSGHVTMNEATVQSGRWCRWGQSRRRTRRDREGSSSSLQTCRRGHPVHARPVRPTRRADRHAGSTSTPAKAIRSSRRGTGSASYTGWPQRLDRTSERYLRVRPDSSTTPTETAIASQLMRKRDENGQR